VIRGVFFDLDDTLIDSGPAFSYGCRAALSLVSARFPSLKHEHIEREWWKTLSDSMAAMTPEGSMQQVRETRIPRLLERLGIVDPEFASEADLVLGQAQLSVLQPFPDIAVLDELSLRFELGVITNGAADDHWDSQVTKARHTGLFDRFGCFLVSDLERARKPKPEMFLTACTRFGFSPEECVYVGDSPVNDVAGAQAAGMGAVWLNREGRTFRFEREPWRTIASLSELPGILSPGKIPIS